MDRRTFIATSSASVAALSIARQSATSNVPADILDLIERRNRVLSDIRTLKATYSVITFGAEEGREGGAACYDITRATVSLQVGKELVAVAEARIYEHFKRRMSLFARRVKGGLDESFECVWNIGSGRWQLTRVRQRKTDGQVCLEGLSRLMYSPFTVLFVPIPVDSTAILATVEEGPQYGGRPVVVVKTPEGVGPLSVRKWLLNPENGAVLGGETGRTKFMLYDFDKFDFQGHAFGAIFIYRPNIPLPPKGTRPPSVDEPMFHQAVVEELAINTPLTSEDFALPAWEVPEGVVRQTW